MNATYDTMTTDELLALDIEIEDRLNAIDSGHRHRHCRPLLCQRDAIRAELNRQNGPGYSWDDTEAATRTNR